MTLESQPRKNGELVFDAPWERRLFGITVALEESGVFAWDDFRALLIEEIARWEANARPGEAYHYYAHWERALARLLAARGLVDEGAWDAKTHELEARPHGHDH